MKILGRLGQNWRIYFNREKVGLVSMWGDVSIHFFEVSKF